MSLVLGDAVEGRMPQDITSILISLNLLQFGGTVGGVNDKNNKMPPLTRNMPGAQQCLTMES